MATTRDAAALPIYSSKIIKAGALLEDTRTILLSWDLQASPKENLARILEENTLGKASRSRVVDELAVFRQRYFGDPMEARALAILAKSGWSDTALSRVLLYFAARSDPLVHGIVVALLVPMYRRGHYAVGPADVEGQVREWVSEGRTVSAWSNKTVMRVAQESLAALRDFGLLTGVVAKTITPPYVPPEAAAFIAFLLSRAGTSSSGLTTHPDWALYFLEPASVERLLLEAHQKHLLNYHAAGRLVRVDFSASTIEDYAHALTERPDRALGTGLDGESAED